MPTSRPSGRGLTGRVLNHPAGTPGWRSDQCSCQQRLPFDHRPRPDLSPACRTLHRWMMAHSPSWAHLDPDRLHAGPAGTRSPGSSSTLTRGKADSDGAWFPRLPERDSRNEYNKPTVYSSGFCETLSIVTTGLSGAATPGKQRIPERSSVARVSVSNHLIWYREGPGIAICVFYVSTACATDRAQVRGDGIDQTVAAIAKTVGARGRKTPFIAGGVCIDSAHRSCLHLSFDLLSPKEFDDLTRFQSDRVRGFPAHLHALASGMEIADGPNERSSERACSARSNTARCV